MTVSFVIQLPSRNYASISIRRRGALASAAIFERRLLYKERRSPDRRFGEGGLESALPWLTGDGVAAADVQEHFPEASRVRSTAVRIETA